MAQRKGARAVLATLWNVADASTGRLMREFYRLRASVLLGAVHSHRQLEIKCAAGESDGNQDLSRGAVLQSHFFGHVLPSSITW
jgi:CHAT domain